MIPTDIFLLIPTVQESIQRGEKMADDIRRLRHTAEELDEAVDMLLETYTRKEIDDKFAEIMQKLTALESPPTE